LLSGAVLCVLASSLLVPVATAAPGLPRTYGVQTVDSPDPSARGNFGLAMVNAGDVDLDGEDDLLVGTDEHGGSVSPVFLISGETGATIRQLTAPDPGGAGGAPGQPGPAGFGSYVGKLPDLGSCPGGSVSVTCPLAAVGPADGRPEQLVTALGVDVAGVVDAGRAYVMDGATGAVLKRLNMPAADLDSQRATPIGPVRPAFGRTVLNPSSPYGPTRADLSGPSAPAPGVAIGDMDGGGAPDIAVGASDFFETGATANPESACAAAGPAAQCLQAGREYVFFGETIAGSDPAVIDDTPDVTITNPAAQPDDTATSVNVNRESMGYSVAPVGDVGRCRIDPGPGRACTVANSETAPDGRPELALSSHRSDDFGMFDAGVVLLIDGATRSVLVTYRHPEPQPASIFGFSNYNQPAVGDLGNSVAPDVYQAAIRQNNPFTGGGRGFAMNGNFRQTGSPNGISFATFNDPTPNPNEDFGTSSAGIGDVAGDGRTEVLVGAYGPHNPGTNADVVNDVHIFSALTERPLQTIPAPDPQPGAGFGTALAPLGDLNEDGFADFAIGAGLWDGPGGRGDQGRIYLLRSDNSPAPPTPAPPDRSPVRSGRRDGGSPRGRRAVGHRERPRRSHGRAGEQSLACQPWQSHPVPRLPGGVQQPRGLPVPPARPDPAPVDPEPAVPDGRHGAHDGRWSLHGKSRRALHGDLPRADRRHRVVPRRGLAGRAGDRPAQPVSDGGLTRVEARRIVVHRLAKRTGSS
jgi:hypothetical protein